MEKIYKCLLCNEIIVDSDAKLIYDCSVQKYLHECSSTNLGILEQIGYHAKDHMYENASLFEEL